MSDTCPTVKVKTDAPDNEDGFIVINESDFDPAVHARFEDVPDDAPKRRGRPPKVEAE